MRAIGITKSVTGTMPASPSDKVVCLDSSESGATQIHAGIPAVELRADLPVPGQEQLAAQS
jgi:hypothetical protein